MAADGVVRIRRIELIVRDLQAMTRFYSESFGFEVVAGTTRADGIDLRLGADDLRLTACDPPGADYPAAIDGADVRFQHFAIVVRDMHEAYGVLTRGGAMSPISTAGPERLPANTGGVTAFKFRDPEGHPLELSMLPPGVGAARWRAPASAGNCLGIDHSALSVSDVAASVAFYSRALGMTVSGSSLNRGPEQDRLDALASEGVEIVALHASEESSPHIELLGYPRPRSGGTRVRPNDIAATRLQFQVTDLPATVERLRGAGADFISPGAVELEYGVTAALVADPDGHLLLFSETARMA